jgi:hypothetical protein
MKTKKVGVDFDLHNEWLTEWSWGMNLTRVAKDGWS